MEPGQPLGVREEAREQVEEEISGIIKQGIEELLQTAYHELQCDLLNFSSRINWADPNYWRANRENWEEVCEAMSWSVEVESIINRAVLANGLML